MLALSAIPITHADVWVAICLVMLITLLIKACRLKWPEPATMQGYATITNTPGGLILILTSLFVLTLFLTIGFAVWIIARGIDPQNAVAITILGMLSSGAFGGVSGALFSQMKGQDPHPPNSTTSTVVSTVVADTKNPTP